jgi:Transposase
MEHAEVEFFCCCQMGPAGYERLLQRPIIGPFRIGVVDVCVMYCRLAMGVFRDGHALPLYRRTFGTMTRELLAWTAWLTEASITLVAMESMREYWKSVYHLLEGTFTVFLVNATHVKNVPGWKTDKADVRWLAKLMCFGLLQASFTPPRGNVTCVS